MVRGAVLPMGLVFALALPLQARAADPDPWFGRDKALHFGISAALAGSGYAAGALIFPEHRTAPFLTGAGLSLTLGVGKEVLDHLSGRRFSARDLVWDVAGTAVGLAVAWAIDALLIRPLTRSHDRAMGAASWSRP